MRLWCGTKRSRRSEPNTQNNMELFLNRVCVRVKVQFSHKLYWIGYSFVVSAEIRDFPKNMAHVFQFCAIRYVQQWRWKYISISFLILFYVSCFWGFCVFILPCFFSPVSSSTRWYEIQANHKKVVKGPWCQKWRFRVIGIKATHGTNTICEPYFFARFHIPPYRIYRTLKPFLNRTRITYSGRDAMACPLFPVDLLLVLSSWLLALGCWMLDVSCWLLFSR